MSNHTEQFLAATGRRGQLYPDATVIASFGDDDLIEWKAVTGQGEPSETLRTWVNRVTGGMRPGLLGDADFVRSVLAKKAKRAAAEKTYRRNRQKDASL